MSTESAISKIQSAIIENPTFVRLGASLLVGAGLGYITNSILESSKHERDEKRRIIEAEEKKKEDKRRLKMRRELEEAKIKSDPELFYDLVFYAGSPPTISNGWAVKRSLEIKTSLAYSGGMNGVIVAIIGGFDKGKSMLFTKLVDIDLPSGSRVHTQGLSFKELQYEGKRFVLLDSAGLNSPIQINNKTNSVEEKEAEECFMQDLIFEISDLFIYVVNEITWREQVELHRFTQRLKESNKSWKQVFVVHNFKNSNDQDELDMLWKEQVLMNYQTSTVVEQNLTTVAFNNTTGEYEPKPVPYLASESMSQRHFYIGCESTDSGHLHNPWAYSLIRQSLCLSVSENSEFNLLDRIKAACTKYLPAYIDQRDVELAYETQEDHNLLLKSVNVEEPLRITSRSRGALYWNVSKNENEYSEPQVIYDIYRFVDYYQIQIEAPGVDPEEVEIIGTLATNSIEVKFIVQEEVNHDKVIDNVQTRRKFGRKQVTIPVPNEFNIVKKCRNVEIKDGLIDIILPKRDDDDDE